MGMELRALDCSNLDDFFELHGLANHCPLLPGQIDAWRDALDLSLSVGAFDGSRLVGAITGGLGSITVPGTAIAATVLSNNLIVTPDGHGKGIGTRVLRRQFEIIRDAGIGFAVFSVSAAAKALHDRIGSAPAVMASSAVIRRPRSIESSRAPVTHTVVTGAGAHFEHTWPAYTRFARSEPGMVTPNDKWITAYRRADTARDAEPRDLLVCRGEDDEVSGYALIRTQSGHGSASSASRTVVEEIMAADGRVMGNLWAEVCSLGIDVVEFPNCRVSDPIEWWPSVDHGTVERGPVYNTLWTRVLNVPRMLMARKYGTNGHLTLKVVDTAVAGVGGVFELEVENTDVACRPCHRSPDVSLPAGAVGAMYFGGIDPWTLHSAGLIECDRAVLSKLQLMFRSDIPARTAITL